MADIYEIEQRESDAAWKFHEAVIRERHGATLQSDYVGTGRLLAEDEHYCRVHHKSFFDGDTEQHYQTYRNGEWTCQIVYMASWGS